MALLESGAQNLDKGRIRGWSRILDRLNVRVNENSPQCYLIGPNIIIFYHLFQELSKCPQHMCPVPLRNPPGRNCCWPIRMPRGTRPQRVQRMFAAIAPSYDLNNRLHSLGMDQHWRSVAVKMAAVKAMDVIVDVACGTGDLTLKLAQARECQGSLARGKIMGIDFTYEMLPIARHKAYRTFGRLTEADCAEAAGADIDPMHYSQLTSILCRGMHWRCHWRTNLWTSFRLRLGYGTWRTGEWPSTNSPACSGRADG